jgi:D-arginine dehydrogenase
MDTHAFDVIVIGAGIAGATCAAHLSADHKVALIEAEEQAGYHTTGRSAAVWDPNYGLPEILVLTRMSRDFFVSPPPGFAETPLVSPRNVVYLAPENQVSALEQKLAGNARLREISIARLCEMIPALKPGYAVRGAIEGDAFDMDVAAIHQGFLRQLRANSGILALRSRAGRISRDNGHWHVEVTGGAVYHAPIVVNAAGAWGDEVAEHAGVRRLGLVPKRRTGVIIDPAPFMPADWPMINDVAHTWYSRPEARTKLMLSPADETDDVPHDVQPDELDVAIAVDRMQQALDIEVRRVEHAWAGLRTFTPDRNFAFGFDGTAEGFFWCVGQGGYGIQTAPVAGQLVADIISGRDPGAAGGVMAGIDPRRFAD